MTPFFCLYSDGPKMQHDSHCPLPSLVGHRTVFTLPCFVCLARSARGRAVREAPNNNVYEYLFGVGAPLPMLPSCYYCKDLLFFSALSTFDAMKANFIDKFLTGSKKAWGFRYCLPRRKYNISYCRLRSSDDFFFLRKKMINRS